MWDYIIVGAGTAGCVLANELSAKASNRILLLEAGGTQPMMSRIPAGMPKLFHSAADWAFESEPVTPDGERRIFVPRGKMLGGSANMNAQIHQWCHPRDFDEWAEGGADGWAWADVLPSFRAMERLRGPEDGNQLRGRLGAMRVEVPRSESLLPPLWVEAARNCGLNGT